MLGDFNNAADQSVERNFYLNGDHLKRQKSSLGGLHHSGELDSDERSETDKTMELGEPVNLGMMITE